MSTPDTAAAARELNRSRWGNQVAVRSARITIERADELPADLREAVHLATGPAGGDDVELGAR